MNTLTDILNTGGGVATNILGALNPPKTTTVVQQPAPAPVKSNNTLWIVGGIAAAVVLVLALVLGRK